MGFQTSQKDYLSNGHCSVLSTHYTPCLREIESAAPQRAMLKPYTFRSQCLPSDYSIFPFNPITKINSSLRNSILFPNFLSLLRFSHRTRTQQPIVCARKKKGRGWSQASNRKMLELASNIALNLKILPQPFNFLIGEIARGGWNGVVPSEYLNHLGWRGKTKTKRRRKLTWFAFMLICVLGLVLGRISELDQFLILRASLFCLLGISLIRFWCGKKAIKEWFLGFLFGIVLMSNRLGKEDVKFWAERLRDCSPVAQIVIRNRNTKRRN